jgi:hypothetical protein
LTLRMEQRRRVFFSPVSGEPTKSIRETGFATYVRPTTFSFYSKSRISKQKNIYTVYCRTYYNMQYTVTYIFIIKSVLRKQRCGAALSIWIRSRSRIKMYSFLNLALRKSSWYSRSRRCINFSSRTRIRSRIM